MKPRLYGAGRVQVEQILVWIARSKSGAQQPVILVGGERHYGEAELPEEQ